ncbi:hypothetical protein ABK040_005699 [Willaertia magna]
MFHNSSSPGTKSPNINNNNESQTNNRFDKQQQQLSKKYAEEMNTNTNKEINQSSLKEDEINPLETFQCEVKTLNGESHNLFITFSPIDTLKKVKLQILNELFISSNEFDHYSLYLQSSPLNDDIKLSDFKNNTTPSFTLVKIDSLFSKAWFWFLLQGISSITLTLVNKNLSMSLNSPILILAIQNFISIFMFIFFKAIHIFPFDWPNLNQYLCLIPTTFFFVLLTWTSLEGLRSVSVALVIVMRNLVPFLTSVIEAYFGLKINFATRISLLCVFFGSILYNFTDFTLKWNGFHWILINTLCSVLIPIIEKRLLNNLMKGVTPTGMNFTRNVLSIPMLMILVLIRDSYSSVVEMFSEQLTTSSIIYLLITSVFGFSIGLSYFFLLKLVSSTSISIANSTYKLLTLLLSFIFFGITFSSLGWIGILLSFGGIFWYSYESTKPSAPSTSEKPNHTKA